jgi:hypothetical protein
MSGCGQQTLEPQRVPASFHAHQNRPWQLTIELDRFRRGQLSFGVLSGLYIDHGNLLETRMEITAYNLHWRLLSLRVLVLRKNSSLLGTRKEPSLLSNQPEQIIAKR